VENHFYMACLDLSGRRAVVERWHPIIGERMKGAPDGEAVRRADCVLQELHGNRG